MERRLTAILAADVVGYSRLMGTDEVGTLARLKDVHKELVRPKIAERKGRIVKLMGDGLLAEFPSVVEAVNCAIDIQRAMPDREPELAKERRIGLRIGVNLGDIIVEGNDIYGDGVNVAARLESVADPGGICISGEVFRYAKGKVKAEFEDMGEQNLKNVPEPVRVYRIAALGSEPLSGRHLEGPLPLPDTPSIAVLPFTNMSGDPEQEYFSDGITEDIITDLSKLSNLRVAARNSSFVFRNAQMTIQQVASKLHVDYVVEGSVRKSDENVRITAQLIDGNTDAHIWAERYDRQLSNIFELQDEIATSIVEALKVKILPQEEQVFEKYATRDVDAYESYLRARALLREMTRRSVELARQIFKQAVMLDTNYALAFCGLADCASTLAFHYDVEKDVVDEAIECSLKALEIDPALAEAHAAHGQALELKGDLEGAEREYQTAIKLEPNTSVAHFYLGSMYLVQGNAHKGQPFLLKAFELASYDLQAAMMLSNAYRTSGNKRDLAKIARRALDISEQRLKINPEDERAAYVGAMALIDLGESERAIQWADLATATAVEDSRASYNLACLCGLLGDVDNALEHLKEALKMGCSRQKRNWMQVDSDLASVRLDPRFEKLMGQYH
jgi:adenylate cyclase